MSISGPPGGFPAPRRVSAFFLVFNRLTLCYNAMRALQENYTMHRPRILAFIPHYLPGHKSGGPVISLANLAESLGDKLDFRIVTADRDKNDSGGYPGIRADCWHEAGKARVIYLSPRGRSFAGIIRLVKETPHDAVYLNGFFNPVFTARVLFAWRLGLLKLNRVVVAPRGEFSEGAFRLKHFKKSFFTALFRLSGMQKKITWQASSRYEAGDIERALKTGGLKIAVAPDIASPQPPARCETPAETGRGGRLRICFLSRISPMKNLHYALTVLRDVKAPVEFSIYGAVEDRLYWEECGEIIKDAPPNVSVIFHGELEHSNVLKELSRHDIFFLPTLGENFGHAIHEAMSAGLPALISDRTPWRGLEEAGAGWELPLDAPGRFRAVIESQAALSPDEREPFRRGAREFALRAARDPKALSENLALFTGPL